ncbi:unnamed protein product [Kuraishia capsulata CBS 1993]|uniref:Uncharacterized protein n=1 Tax=Kuraishia capsulata CBS 1993 TaxID=1382522 RepID=W6MW70_9ASCO|nr:uncharacterized protein KUCA_T00002937001 [Kuraishia capsulata CBS 1993]CDK26960.1 unnamed protein product [Kuraishia capsulata CBS 1993]
MFSFSMFPLILLDDCSWFGAIPQLRVYEDGAVSDQCCSLVSARCQSFEVLRYDRPLFFIWKDVTYNFFLNSVILIFSGPQRTKTYFFFLESETVVPKFQAHYNTLGCCDQRARTKNAHLK